MANIEEALKKSRKAERAAFTKAYNRVEELITLEGVDICEVEAELNVFKGKADRLEKTHSSILELLPEKDFDAEFEIVEDFRDKAIRIQTKARRIINGQQNVSSVLNSTNNDSAVINSVENVAVGKIKFKLPKLELRKFNGDIKEWLYFWSQFEKIHVDSSIDDSDKFQYLLQSTVEGSRAREVIESFPPTGDNYPKAIDCLKTRFGRHDLQVEVYVRELLKLVLKNANLNFSSNNLCVLYDNLEQQIRALETLGVTTDKCACLLYPLVESCMPEDLLRAFQRGLNFDSCNDSKKKLDALLKFLKTEVESEERINLAMAGFGLTDAASYKSESKLKKDKIFTSACLLSSSVGKEKLCVFCSGKHEPTNCFKAQKMFYNEKLKILKDKGYCFKCLKGGHRVGKCRRFVKCMICNKMHYAVMCTKSNKNVNKPTNNLEKEVKEQDKSLNMASILNAPQVLLQTLKVKIKSKNCSLIIRAMYDSGSQKSYIRKEIVSALRLAPSRQQHLSHALFGGGKINEKFHNVYKIELESLDGSFNCNFDVVDQDIICNDVPSVSYGPWIEELQSMNIQIFDIGNNSGPIDILLGADVAGRLFTGKRKVLSSGLVAMETYLGWTLMGKTNLLSEKEDTAMMVISMIINEVCDEVAKASEKVSKYTNTDDKEASEKSKLSKITDRENGLSLSTSANDEDYLTDLPDKFDHEWTESEQISSSSSEVFDEFKKDDIARFSTDQGIFTSAQNITPECHLEPDVPLREVIEILEVVYDPTEISMEEVIENYAVAASGSKSESLEKGEILVDLDEAFIRDTEIDSRNANEPGKNLEVSVLDEYIEGISRSFSEIANDCPYNLDCLNFEGPNYGNKDQENNYPTMLDDKEKCDFMEKLHLCNDDPVSAEPYGEKNCDFDPIQAEKEFINDETSSASVDSEFNCESAQEYLRRIDKKIELVGFQKSPTKNYERNLKRSNSTADLYYEWFNENYVKKETEYRWGSDDEFVGREYSAANRKKVVNEFKSRRRNRR